MGKNEPHIGADETYQGEQRGRPPENGTNPCDEGGPKSVEMVYRVADETYAYAEGGHNLAEIGNCHADYQHPLVFVNR